MSYDDVSQDFTQRAAVNIQFSTELSHVHTSESCRLSILHYSTVHHNHSVYGQQI